MLHSEHLYGLSPVWILICVYRFEDWLNVFWHMWHLYGFSPLWILLWRVRFAACVYRLLQTVHSNGFSPEWIRLCRAKFLRLWQHLPHSVHLYLYVWIFMWVYKQVRDEKRLSHWVQVYMLSPVCFLLWSFILHFVVNRLWHTVQKYGLCLSLCGCSETPLLSSSVFTWTQSPACQQINMLVRTQTTHDQQN